MTIKKIILSLFSVIFSIALSAQSNTENDSLTLYTYIGGKPDINYVKAKKQVAKKYGLKAQFFYGDCGGTFDYKGAEFKTKNQPAFEYLKKILGTNWQEKFDEEIRELRDRNTKKKD